MKPHPPYLWLLLLLLPLYFLAQKWEQYEAAQPKPKPSPIAVYEPWVTNTPEAVPAVTCTVVGVTNTADGATAICATPIPLPTATAVSWPVATQLPPR